MGATGGSIRQASIRGRLFSVAADSDLAVKIGGYENEVQPNGDGTVRTVKSFVPWSVSGLKLVIDNDRADLEFLQEIADSLELVDCTFTYASGHVRQGRGTITGEIAGSSQSATAEVNLMGEETLTLQ